jgi:hypothetical protein
MTQWEDKLRDCDFELAREEITDFIRMQNEEARKLGGDYIWENETAESIKLFLAQPNQQTAEKLLNCAPAFLNYFEESKPTGNFAFYKRMRRK